MSLLIKIFFDVLPIRRISSRYITRRMFSSRAIGTFNSYENILGAGPNPKKSRESRRDFSTKQVSQTLLSSCTMALKNRHLSDLLVEKIISLDQVFQTMQTLHFEMLIWNKLAESF